VLSSSQVSITENDAHGRLDRCQLVVRPALSVRGGRRQAAEELVEVVRVRRQPEAGLLQVVEVIGVTHREVFPRKHIG
jgi:hypothetical protein